VLNIGYFVFGCFEHSVLGVFWKVLESFGNHAFEKQCFGRHFVCYGTPADCAVVCRCCLLLRWYSVGTPLVLRWYSVGTPLVLRWYSVGTPLVLRWYSVVVVLSASGAYSNVDRTLHTGGSFTQHVYYAVAASNVWDPTYVYDCPAGYHWASTDEALQWVGTSGGTSGGTTTTPRQPSYYDQCGWEGYMFGGKKRVKFRFSDSPTTGAYKSAGTYEDGDIVVGDFTTKEFAGTVCVKAADDGDVVRRRRTWR
jgi:hypothetical protein